MFGLDGTVWVVVAIILIAGGVLEINIRIPQTLKDWVRSKFETKASAK